jgi:hypothetical protein
MPRLALIGSGAGGLVTIALVANWFAAALLVAAILIPATVLCWVLNDKDRPKRLALLMTAWRHGVPDLLESDTCQNPAHARNIAGLKARR